MSEVSASHARVVTNLSGPLGLYNIVVSILFSIIPILPQYTIVVSIEAFVAALCRASCALYGLGLMILEFRPWALKAYKPYQPYKPHQPYKPLNPKP